MDTIKGKHVTKLIFEKIGFLLDLEPFDVYTAYLKKSLNVDLNLKTFSKTISLDDKHVSYYYKNVSEKCEFFCHKNYKNWAMINRNVLPSDVRIDFYIKNCAGDLTKIFDYSTINSLFLSEQNTHSVFKFILDKNELYVGNRATEPNLSYTSELNFMTEQVHSSDNVHEIILKLLKQKWKNAKNLGFIEMVNCENLYTDVKAPILICSHINSKFLKKNVGKLNDNEKGNKQIKIPSVNSLTFYIIATFNESMCSEPIIICLTRYNDKYLGYIPKKKIYNFIVSNQLKSHQQMVSGVKNFYDTVKTSGTDTRKKKKANKQKKKPDIKGSLTYSEWWKAYSCRCFCCRLSDKYKKNFKFFKLQQRFPCKLSSINYLKIFNFYSKKNIKKLKKIYELSISAVDLESFTIRSEKYDSKFKHILKYPNEATTVAEQDICLIGFGDTVLEDQNIHVFQSTHTNDPELAVECFIDHLLQRYEELRIKKEKLLEPLINFANKCQKVHYTFWKKRLKSSLQTDVEIEKKIHQSFTNGLIGKFRTHLKRITRMLYVNAFNGGR